MSDAMPPLPLAERTFFPKVMYWSLMPGSYPADTHTLSLGLLRLRRWWSQLNQPEWAGRLLAPSFC